MKIDINQVIGRLSAKIANLETQLAHAQALNDVYAEKIKELEGKLKEEKENAE